MPWNPSRPRPQMYLVNYRNDDGRVVAMLVTSPEGQTPPGRPATPQHAGVPPSPRG